MAWREMLRVRLLERAVIDMWLEGLQRRVFIRWRLWAYRRLRVKRGWPVAEEHDALRAERACLRQWVRVTLSGRRRAMYGR